MLWALPEIVLPLIIAFLVGLLIGWLWWGWRRTKISYTEWETMRQKSNRASAIDTDAEIMGLKGDLDARDAELATLRAEADDLRTKLADCEASKADASEADDSEADDSEADDSEAAALGGGVLAGAAMADAGSGDDVAADDGGAADDVAIQGLVSTDDGAEATPEAAPEEMTEATEAAAEEMTEAAEDTAEEMTEAAEDTAVEPAAGLRAVTGKRHPYGVGSHAPWEGAKREMPEGYPIKGNVDSMLYHRPDSRNYGATIAEVWFDMPESAEAAGFELSKSHPSPELPDGMTFTAAPAPSAQALADDGSSDEAPAAAVGPDEVVGGEPHPYGEGSHAPFADDVRRMPAGYTIKGNVDSMLYHRKDSRNYGATKAEVWFDTAERAEAAGFTLSPTHPS